MLCLVVQRGIGQTISMNGGKWETVEVIVFFILLYTEPQSHIEDNEFVELFVELLSKLEMLT